MNALKFQHDMITERFKDGKDKDAAWGKIDDDHIGLCLRSNVIACIPASSCYIDTSKLCHIPTIDRIVKGALCAYADKNLLTYTGRALLGAKGRKVLIFTVNGREVGIDQKLLSYFDLAHAKLYQERHHYPILVMETFEAEECVGVVMPYNLASTKK